MPRYFFDYFENGEVFKDEAGLELADVEAARQEASQIASEIGRDYLTRLPHSGYVEVQARDEHGEALFAMSLKLTVDGAHVLPLDASGVDVLGGGVPKPPRTDA